MKCKICSKNLEAFGKATIINKYEIAYFKCSHCGFVQTEDPFWLPESYSEAINRSDLGLVSRNVILSKITRSVIFSFFNKNGHFIDYGGGYGLFVRLMRDAGIDFWHYDKYCKNLFAQGFEADISKSARYDLLTAFEVFEHLQSPIDEVRKMLLFSENILFTTELFPNYNPQPNEWWYYGLDHGQHISIYSARSLAIMAGQLDMHIYSAGSLHLMTKKEINQIFFALMARNIVATILSPVFRKKSLLSVDYADFIKRNQSG